MYSFILGFQRLVWCPKWTPASSNSFMVILAKLPPYWIASSAAQIARSGLIPLSAPVRAGGKILAPVTTCLYPLAGPQAAGKIHKNKDGKNAASAKNFSASRIGSVCAHLFAHTFCALYSGHRGKGNLPP